MAVDHTNAENWLFHIGQLCLLIGYFFGVATVVNGIHRFWGMPFYRSVLAFGNFLLVFWAALQAKALDHMIWNIAFFCFNFFHFVYLMLFEKKIVLNDYLNNLWYKMFNEDHYNLELLDYYNLMQEKAFLKTYHNNQFYIQEADVPTQLSILLSGRMRIMKRDDFQRRGVTMAHESLASELRVENQTPEDNDVGVVYPYEFIDSYEWLSVQGDAQVPGVAREVTSQVSIQCQEGDCVVLTWKNSTLDSVFKEYPRLKVCISALVGKDIAEKMLRITGHAVDDISPDVDMVRKTKSCFTKRAEVLNAKLTPEERKVDPSMTHRATKVYDQTATKIFRRGDVETREEWSALTEKQQYIRSVLGSGPWCDLRDEELSKPPWQTTVGFEEQTQTIADTGSTVVEHKRVEGVPWRPEDFNHHLLQKEMHSLQRARLRVANARLLAINPAPLESLHPKSDSSEENQVHGAKLMQYFEDVLPELPKKDLHEVLKWGKWRSYYRPGTVLQRQGEEAHYIGIVIQGRLAYYSEDEITRSKSLVHFVDRFQLVGSEDFTSKYRTARRTIAMPDLVRPEANEGEDPPQRLPETAGETRSMSMPTERDMYENVSIKTAELWKDAQQRSAEEKIDMEARIKEAKAKQRKDGTTADDNAKVVLLTRIPTVLFCWDHNDLKRLVLADPHVESCISTLLRGDITFKLDNASDGALPTRVCGVPGPARGDHDVRLCNAGA